MLLKRSSHESSYRPNSRIKLCIFNNNKINKCKDALLKQYNSQKKIKWIPKLEIQ